MDIIISYMNEESMSYTCYFPGFETPVRDKS